MQIKTKQQQQNKFFLKLEKKNKTNVNHRTYVPGADPGFQVRGAHSN